jgi:hypothetical protein
MEADGALQPKLDTVLEVHKVWADAYSKAGQQVPQIVMGGGSSGQTSMGNAQAMMEILAAKAAKDFAVDLGVGGKSNTAKK